MWVRRNRKKQLFSHCHACCLSINLSAIPFRSRIFAKNASKQRTNGIRLLVGSLPSALSPYNRFGVLPRVRQSRLSCKLAGPSLRWNAIPSKTSSVWQQSFLWTSFFVFSHSNALGKTVTFQKTAAKRRNCDGSSSSRNFEESFFRKLSTYELSSYPPWLSRQHRLPWQRFLLV